MTELAFLSVEVENDSEINEDDGERVTSIEKQPNGGANLDLKYGDIHENNTGRETVEICQKTVNPNNRVNSENFIIQRVIGKGGYGKVFLVQKVDGNDKGKLYAMKVLKKARLVCNEKDKAHTVSERNILQMLRHPFLVKLHYAFQNHSNLYIVLEYCPGGELFNYLEREGALLENAACFYTAEIILAIGHLHSLGIIYRDLKSENVLLDRQGHVKLTDFGLSKEGVCTTNTFCGTIEYMAPEIIRCEGHGKAVDWWSLGTLLFDMLSGGPPFSQEDSREATTLKILTAPLKFPPSFSPEVTSLLRGLLKRDPKERLGSKEDVDELKRHKFFRRHEINWSDVFHRRLRPPFRPKLLADNDVSMFDPTFTRLQPVVSPSETNRSIPPDMFQGFSYVAQSACDDSVREPVLESHGGRRRQCGSRGALSTGRLRRLEVAPLHWSGKLADVQNTRLAALVNLAPQLSGFADAHQIGLQHCPSRPNSTLPICGVPMVQPLSHTNNLSRQITGMTLDRDMTTACSKEVPAAAEYPVVVGQEATGDMDTELDDTGEEDDEEELEEENVPGAKHIQGANGSMPFMTHPVETTAVGLSTQSTTTVTTNTLPENPTNLVNFRPGHHTRSGYHNHSTHSKRAVNSAHPSTQPVRSTASFRTAMVDSRRQPATRGAATTTIPSATPCMATSVSSQSHGSAASTTKCSVM